MTTELIVLAHDSLEDRQVLLRLRVLTLAASHGCSVGRRRLDLFLFLDSEQAEWAVLAHMLLLSLYDTGHKQRIGRCQ